MIKNNRGLKRIWLWIGGVFLGIMMVLGIAALYFSVKWKPLLSEKIKTGVYNGSHRLYKIDFKDIHLNLFTGSATLNQVTLIPDTLVFDSLKKLKLAPAHLMELQLNQLDINRVGILNAYFKKKLNISSIVLREPTITLTHRKVDKRPDTVINETTLFQQISKTFTSISLHRLNIVNANLAYLNGDNGRKQHTIKKLSVEVNDFLLDSLSDQDTNRFYYTREVSFTMTGYQSLTADKMYTMKVDTITGSVKEKTLELKGFYMLPMYAELPFSRRYKTQKDRFDMHFEKVNFRGIDFVKLDQEGKLHARTLVIGPAKVAIFMNRELPPPSFDKGRNYPHVALQRLDLPLHLDTLKLKNLHVAYSEYNPISQKKGTVDLENLSGTILNVTNDSLQLTKNNHAIANLSTRIIKAAQIKVHINFNLTSKSGAFSYSGNIGPLNMTELNPLSRNLGLVKIDQGKIQKADFNINGDTHGANGTMRFYYSDLKITMLKESEKGEPFKEKGFLSFLANTIVVKNDNPSKGETLRIAKISFQRTPAASFFNLLWKSVFVGIRETIGIGMVPVKSPEKAFDKVVDKKEERKEKREEKKEERQKDKERKAEEEITAKGN
ncbi:hypothetical protein [Pedobacter sp.]|uniref:hypothetical protein n=1 Tax=Pedobacter sp. TaxID=1411316 RepID=UPI003D7F375F